MKSTKAARNGWCMGKPTLLHDKMMDYTYAYAVQVLRTHLPRRTTLRNGNKKNRPRRMPEPVW